MPGDEGREGPLAEFAALRQEIDDFRRAQFQILALLLVDWSIAGTSRQGYPIDLNGTAADVVRRDADGPWRYVIDNPFGIVEPEPPAVS